MLILALLLAGCNTPSDTNTDQSNSDNLGNTSTSSSAAEEICRKQVADARDQCINTLQDESMHAACEEAYIKSLEYCGDTEEVKKQPTPEEPPEETSEGAPEETPEQTPSEPVNTPEPTPKPALGTVVMNGREIFTEELSTKEQKALEIALKNKSFELFYELDSIYDDYLMAKLDSEIEHRGCSELKKTAFEAFLEGRKITIEETENNLFTITVSHDVLFLDEAITKIQEKEKVFEVDTVEEKTVRTTFYQPYTGLLLYRVFSEDESVIVGFREDYYGTDLGYMSNKFADAWCELNDESFR